MALQTYVGLLPSGQRVFAGPAAPSASSETFPPNGFRVGDIVLNTVPSIGSPSFWLCTTAGATGAAAVFSAMPDAGLALNTAAGISPIRVAHARYDFSVDGGAIATITPAFNATIPDNAIIMNAIINPTVALTSGGSATIAVGTSAGSSTTSIKGATAVASYSLEAMVQSVPVPQTASTWVKMSAAGQITITVATATLLTGVMDIFVLFVAGS